MHRPATPSPPANDGATAGAPSPGAAAPGASLWGPVEALGAQVLAGARSAGDAIYLLANSLAGVRDLGGRAGFLLRQTIVQQMYFTAVQAFWLINLIGIALGVLVILPLLNFGVSDVTVQAKVIQLALFHQLVPLLTALVVIGRSGTAITAEIGDLNQCGAIDSLLAIGVEPHRFLVLPRLLGLSASLLLLTLWCNIAAVTGAGVYNALGGYAGFDNFVRACAAVLSPLDLLFTLLMVLCYGVAIALVHCHFGLVSESTTAMQRNLPRAFVASMLAVVGLTVLFVVLRP